MATFGYRIVVDGDVVESGNRFETESACRAAMFHQAWLYQAEMVQLLEGKRVIAGYDWHHMKKVMRHD